MRDLLSVLDVLAGVVLLLLAAVEARRSRRSALLAAAAGIAWLAAPLVPALLLVHRPLVLHTAFALPGRRSLTRQARAALVLAWAGALIVPLGRSPEWMLLVGAVVAVEAARRLPRARLHSGSAVTAGPALALVALSLALPGTARLLGVGGEAAAALAALYSGLVLAAGLALLTGVLLTVSGHETDAVIELSEGTSAETAAGLRRAAASRDGPAERAPLMAAAELLETHAVLQDELAAKVEEVRASRRRLVDAVVVERRRLEGALADGAVRYLDELADTLRELNREQARSSLLPVGVGGAGPGGGKSAPAASCLEQVALCLDDLQMLAGGLHPRVLAQAGLAPALAELAARSPVPTAVHVPDVRLAPDVEAAVWYACAEALANVAKHAQASSAGIDLTVESGTVVARVRDDGAGGAAVRAGGGLAGLADRLSALGGQVDVTSSPGAGTLVQIRLPSC